jgi:LysR family hydrogen peroxide-inducible transcriptional activator
VQRDVVYQRDMSGTAFLGLEPRHHGYRQTRAICEEFDAHLLRDYEGTSLDSLRQMAGSGLGFAVLPELYLRAEAHSVEVVVPLRFADWQQSRSIGAIWRQGSAFSSQYQMLAEIIAAEAQAIFASPF